MHKSIINDNKNSSLPKMPFVTGKSLTKSHNLGVTIQQTQSLLQIKMNKKLIQKQPSTTQLLQSDNFSNKSTISAKSSTVTVSTYQSQEDICPILKYNTSYLINNPRWNEDKAKLNDTNKRTVDEIWADYMFDIESKNIIPLKCTCSQLRNTSQRPNKISQRKLEDSPLRKRADLSVIYSEAEKIVKECHLLPQPTEGESIGEELPLFVANQLKPTKSTTMAKYMRQIKQLRDRLNSH